MVAMRYIGQDHDEGPESVAVSIDNGPKFSLGSVCMTRGIQGKIESGDLGIALSRHISGDWGDVGPEDWQANEDALENDHRLFSVYHSANGTKFWIITEWDRSVTTVLLPSEY